MISRDKHFPVPPYKAPRPKSLNTVNLQGKATSSQLKPEIYAEADKRRVTRMPRMLHSPRAPQRSPAPTPVESETVGEVIARGGASCVRLRRALQTLINNHPSFDMITLSQMLAAFRRPVDTLHPRYIGNKSSLLDFEQFVAAMQSVFEPLGAPVERRILSRIFALLDASDGGEPERRLFDHRLLVLDLLKLLQDPLADKLKLMFMTLELPYAPGDRPGNSFHKGAETSAFSDFLARSFSVELDYVDYVKKIVSLMAGSKDPDMLPWDVLLSASKREPLILRAFRQAMSFSPVLHALLHRLQLESQIANSSAAALMMANAGAGGADTPPFDWKCLRAAWDFVSAKQKVTNQTIVSKGEFVQYMAEHLGGAETDERRIVLEQIFDAVEPYGSGTVDTRECFYWLSKGVKIHNDADGRLQFLVSLHERAVGAGGPNGQQMAVPKKIFLSVLTRCYDELGSHNDEVATTYREKVLENGVVTRLELEPLLAVVSKDPTFQAQLSSVL